MNQAQTKIVAPLNADPYLYDDKTKESNLAAKIIRMTWFVLASRFLTVT